jgi:hypothetical protein
MPRRCSCAEDVSPRKRCLNCRRRTPSHRHDYPARKKLRRADVGCRSTTVDPLCTRLKKLRHFVAQGTCQHAGGWHSGRILDFQSRPCVPEALEKHHNRAWIEIDVFAKCDVVRIDCPAMPPGFQEVANVQEKASKKRLVAIDIGAQTTTPQKMQSSLRKIDGAWPPASYLAAALDWRDTEPLGGGSARSP